MRGVGDDDLSPGLRLAAVGEVGAHEQQAGQLALRARRRLERDRRQPRHLGEDLLEPPHELERALGALFLLERVEVAEARQVDDPLVDPRVVLHRAGAERVEAGVDSKGARREPREVADELGLGELRQARRPFAAQLLGDLRDRQVVRGESGGAPPLLRQLVDQLHAASTSASRSMSARVRFSVTQTSSASSRPA